MKPIIRLFFRTIRFFLTPIVLLGDRLTTPKGIVRSPEEQARIDQATAGLTLYHFQACPFCIKTRREIKRLSLMIKLKDAQHDPESREELLKGGGKHQVPCLKIESPDQETRWLYESSHIIEYLQKQFRSVQS